MRKTIVWSTIGIIAVVLALYVREGGDKKEWALNVIFGGVGYEMQSAQEYVGLWKDKAGAEVIINSAVRGTDNRLQQYLPHLTTSSMDVYQVDVVWAPLIADNMEDLRQHFTEEELAEFHPGLINAATIEGKLVFLPLYVQWMALYVRTDLLDKYNRSIPQTWEELEETSAYIMTQEAKHTNSSSKMSGLVFMGQPYEGLTCLALSVLGSSEEGVDLLSTQGDQASVVRSLHRMHKWLYGPNPIVPKGVLTYTQEGARQCFQRGGAVFMINWPYALELMNAEGSPIKGKFTMVSLPSDKGGPAPILGGAGVAVSRHSKFKKEAVSLVRYLTGHSVQKARAEKYGYISSREDVVHGSMLEEWRSAKARPASHFNKWSTVGYKTGEAMYTFLQNKQGNADAVVQAVQSVVKDEIKK